jgi:5-oxoprolinase (ATP-hydrolysing) subunit A
MAWRIDINCDLGEGGDNDAALLDYVTSVNIACGVHAGSAQLMRRTVELAGPRGLALGAHPGLPDRAGMGRREIAIEPQEAADLVAAQVRTLADIAISCGRRLAHVKPHGALYNQAAKDAGLAEAIAMSVREVDDRLILFALAGSCLARAGRDAGLAVAQEAFADRLYQPDGTLVSRGRAGAVIDDPRQSARQAVRLVKEHQLAASGAAELTIHADTLCVHGDSPMALPILRALRETFAREGIEVAPLEPGRLRSEST